jgi:glycosyltransferase involved in cell wall biosynthesis
MRFHLPSLPGEAITVENGTSAFVQKIRKYADMMRPRGHEVITYGGEGANVECYPATDPPAFTPQAWEDFNRKAAQAIAERAEPGDVLAMIGGVCQESLVDALPDLYPVEFGIGYGGSFAPFRIFESVAWQHTTYGEQRGTNTADGSFYHAVIPAYFNPDEHPRHEGKDNYLLYIGRLEERKGVGIAEATAQKLGKRLILAGAGPYRPTYGEAIGVVGPDERARLMSQAEAVLMPTTYIEPFGFVAVEAQLAGTPPITTDWGAFTETVQHGVTGFRCHTLGEFCEAVRRAPDLDGDQLRQTAIDRYGYDAIAPQYETYFDRLTTLGGDGWHSDYVPEGF